MMQRNLSMNMPAGNGGNGMTGDNYLFITLDKDVEVDALYIGYWFSTSYGVGEITPKIWDEQGNLLSSGPSKTGTLNAGQEWMELSLEKIKLVKGVKYRIGANNTNNNFFSGTAPASPLSIGDTSGYGVNANIEKATGKPLIHMWLGLSVTAAINKYLFKDGEEIKKYHKKVEASYSETDVTSTLTNSDVTSSSSLDNNVGHLAINGNTTEFNGWLSTTNNNQWLSYKFNQQRSVKKYKIAVSSSGIGLVGAPKTWRFEGSLDGINWTELDSRSGIVGWSNGVYKEFEIESSKINSFVYYRIYVVENNGSPSYVKITEMRLIEGTVTTPEVLPYWEVVGANTATQELFGLSGMGELSFITNEAIQQLQSDQVELLCWTDEEVVDVPLSYGASDAIPKMTSNNSPSGVASASTIYSPNYDAWKAYDDLLGTSNCWASRTGSTQWLQYKFDVAKRIGKMTMTASDVPSDATTMPTSFSLRASDTGLFSGEEVILYNADEPSHGFWSAGEKKEYAFENERTYLYYRLVMTDKEGPMGQSVEYVIHDMELFEATGGGGPKLVSRYSKTNGIPIGQLLVGLTDISFNYLEAVDVEGKGIKIAVSADSGTTWMGKNQVDITDLTSVKANGFTPEEFNALTKEQLTTLFPNGTARFAFYLEQENLTDVVEIQSLTINEKKYTISPTVSDISVIYEVLKSEQPKLFISRDDGVTWKEVSQDEMASLSDQPDGNKLRVKALLADGQEVQAISYSWA